MRFFKFFFKFFSKKTSEADNEDLLNSVDMEASTSTNIEVQPASPKIQTENAESVTKLQIVKSLSSILLAKENAPRLTASAMLTMFGTGLNFLSPYLFGETVKLLSNNDETTTIGGVEFTPAALITTLVAAYTLSQVTQNLQKQIITSMTSKNTKKAILKSTDHLLKKSLQYHTDTQFSDKIYFIQQNFLLNSVVPPVINSSGTIVEIIVACGVLSSRYGIEMGAGIFGLLASCTAYSAFTAKPIVKAREASLKAGNGAYESFCKAIAQYKTMYDFCKYDETIENVADALDKMVKADITANIRPLQIELGHIGMARICMVIASLYVGLGVKSGKYNVQDFILLAGYLHQLSNLLPGFGQAVTQVFSTIPIMKFVGSELSKRDAVVDLHPDVPLNVKEGEGPSIEFDDVTFSYPAKPGDTTVKPPLFEHLSFKVEPGQKVALISKSGAGKTTIFNLLYGYYPLTHGTIKINGQSISDVSSNDWKSHICLMGQTPDLLSKESIGQNIRFGAKNSAQVTDEDIYNLAETINLYDFLQSFPDKLDTDVGDNGRKLSLGQQQKVAILRAFFKKGNIRLLDEITASLDSHSAKEVLQSIDALPDNVTTLMITHKLTESRFADQIIVIDKGRAIACGTHDELLQNCGLYQELWQNYIEKESKDQSHNESTLPLGTTELINKMGVSTSWKQKEKINDSTLQENVEFKTDENTSAMTSMKNC